MKDAQITVNFRLNNSYLASLKAKTFISRKDYTVPSIIDELQNIEVSKNAKDKYIRRYSLTAKQKNILNQFKLNDKNIDRFIT